MPQLIACPRCQSHVLSSEARCPHCRTPMRRSGGHLALTAAAALLGLTPLACKKEGPRPAPPSDSGDIADPMYGAPETGGPDEPSFPSDPAGPPSQPDPPAPPEGDTELEGGGGPSGPGEDAEPIYGIPES